MAENVVPDIRSTTTSRQSRSNRSAIPSSPSVYRPSSRATPEEFPIRPGAKVLASRSISLTDKKTLSSALCRSRDRKNISFDSVEEDSIMMEDERLELVYTISTRKLRKAPRNELLHHQDFVDQPFTVYSFEHPPLLQDGRRMVIDLPKSKRNIWFYYQSETVLQQTNSTKTVIIKRKKRCVELPFKIWVQRNFLNMWKELWIEMIGPAEDIDFGRL